jgi:hypothetical protein
MPDEYPSSLISRRTKKKIVSRHKVYVQHPDEYLCQNWVIFFADARLANISIDNLLSWFTLYRPFQGLSGKEAPFGTDYAFMVFFHLYHLRRLIHFQAPMFQMQEHMSVPENLHYNMFGIKWDEMHPDFFLPYIGASYDALNTYAQQQPYLRHEATPFPPDSYDSIIDPLSPLLWFVKYENRGV